MRQLLPGRYNLGNATFSRASTAYDEAGRLAGLSVPRITKTAYGKMMMVEEGTTNLVTSQPINLSSFAYRSGVSWANGVHFGDNTVLRYSHLARDLNISSAYALSINIKMDDLSAPAPGDIALDSKDFVLVIAGSICASYFITYLSDNIYRVTGVLTTGTSLVNSYYGVAKFTTQSSKQFTVVGNWQLEPRAYPTSFMIGTRAAESLTMPTAGLSVSEGTIEGIVEITDATKSTMNCNIFNILGTGYIRCGRNSPGTWFFVCNNGSGSTQSDSFSDSELPNSLYYNKAYWFVGLAKIEFWDLKTRTKTLERSISNPNLMGAISSLNVGAYSSASGFANARFGKHKLSNIARTDDPDFNNLMPSDANTVGIFDPTYSFLT
jgi:hypothetical protein